MKEEDFLVGMYKDSYFPDFLVDKVKVNLMEVVQLLENGEDDVTHIQRAFDQATSSINDVQEEFWQNGSEIETAARESIGETVTLILSKYNVPIDCETAIRNRDW